MAPNLPYPAALRTKRFPCKIESAWPHPLHRSAVGKEQHTGDIERLTKRFSGSRLCSKIAKFSCFVNSYAWHRRRPQFRKDQLRRRISQKKQVPSRDLSYRSFLFCGCRNRTALSAVFMEQILMVRLRVSPLLLLESSKWDDNASRYIVSAGYALSILIKTSFPRDRYWPSF